MILRILSVACCVFLSVLTITSTHAASITIASTPNDDGSNPQVMVITDQMGTVEVGNLGIMHWAGSLDTEPFSVAWDLTLDPDPGVSGSLLITNNTNTTQFYSATTGVISSINVPAGAVMTGSSSISVGDTDNSNTTAAMVAPTGDSIYQGLIQNIVQRTLFNDPYTLTAAGNSTNIDTANFGPEATTTALPIGGLLSLRQSFRLTAGDTATALSTFVVEPTVIPVPAAVWLFGSGLIGLIGIARRKKA